MRAPELLTRIDLCRKPPTVNGTLFHRLLLPAFCALALQPAQALTWQYFSTDGTESISGQLTTDGVFADTSGPGTHVFTVLSFDTFFINGVDVASRFGNGAPTFPVPGQNQITYDR